MVNSHYFKVMQIVAYSICQQFNDKTFRRFRAVMLPEGKMRIKDKITAPKTFGEAMDEIGIPKGKKNGLNP